MRPIAVCDPPQVQPVGIDLNGISSTVFLAWAAVEPGDWKLE
jgi:hypothetical protein